METAKLELEVRSSFKPMTAGGGGLKWVEGLAVSKAIVGNEGEFPVRHYQV